MAKISDPNARRHAEATVFAPPTDRDDVFQGYGETQYASRVVLRIKGLEQVPGEPELFELSGIDLGSPIDWSSIFGQLNDNGILDGVEVEDLIMQLGERVQRRLLLKILSERVQYQGAA